MQRKLHWSGDWAATTAFEAAWAEDELRRELAPGHILQEHSWIAVGRRSRSDDYLLRLADGRFVQVHLTRTIETDARFPLTEIFRTFKDWKAAHLHDTE